MLKATFIRMVEAEYKDIVKEAQSLKNEEEQFVLERPYFLCKLVEKFKKWLLMAMRTVNVEDGAEGISPEQALVETVTESEGEGMQVQHHEIEEVLTLFDRDDFISLFSESARESIERAGRIKITKCTFRECYPFCKNFFEDSN